MPFIPVVVFGLILLVLALLVLFAVYFSAKAAVTVAKSLGSGASFTVMPMTVKQSLRDSRRYAKLIKQTVQQQPAGPMRDRLSLTIKPVDEWLTNLDRLEKALSKLYAQRNLGRELRKVNFEIEQLRRQVLTANSMQVRSLRTLMKSKKNHRERLQELQAFQNQAELKIHQIASDLGTAHAEVLLVTSKGDFNDNRFRRLDENLQENLSGLRDILSAMDDMGYTSSAAAG